MVTPGSARALGLAMPPAPPAQTREVGNTHTRSALTSVSSGSCSRNREHRIGAHVPGPAPHAPLPTVPGTTLPGSGAQPGTLWEVNDGHGDGPGIVDNEALAWHRRATSKSQEHQSPRNAPLRFRRESAARRLQAGGPADSCCSPGHCRPPRQGLQKGVTQVIFSRYMLASPHTTKHFGSGNFIVIGCSSKTRLSFQTG